MIRPIFRPISYEFDKAGRLTKKTDQRGTVVDCTHDQRCLMLTKLSGTDLSTFVYDGLGRLETASRGAPGDPEAIGKVTRSWADLSRVTSETQKQLNLPATELTFMPTPGRAFRRRTTTVRGHVSGKDRSLLTSMATPEPAQELNSTRHVAMASSTVPNGKRPRGTAVCVILEQRVSFM